MKKFPQPGDYVEAIGLTDAHGKPIRYGVYGIVLAESSCKDEVWVDWLNDRATSVHPDWLRKLRVAEAVLLRIEGKI